jgi:hypothetical protein
VVIRYITQAFASPNWSGLRQLPQGLNHLKRGLPPALLLCRDYEQSHPTPDREEFIKQYRNAIGRLEMSVFEGEGDRFLAKNLSTTKA